VGIAPHFGPAPIGAAAAVHLRLRRVAASTQTGVRTPTPETATAVHVAADSHGAAGASIAWDVPPDLAEAWRAWNDVIASDGHAWLTRLITAAGTSGHGSYDTRGWVEFAPPVPADELTARLERGDAVRSRLLRWFARADVILCPAMPQPAIRHGESNADWFGDTYSDVHNLTGWPAAVVRAGTAPGGLPIGVQLIAHPWREDVALAAAKAVETATGGWRPSPL
jgi:amidase